MVMLMGIGYGKNTMEQLQTLVLVTGTGHLRGQWTQCAHVLVTEPKLHLPELYNV